MKKYLLSIIALSTLLLGSCEKESEGLTFTTSYPLLSLDGETTIIIDKGGAFAEPGYSAILDGADVTDQVVVTNSIDASTSGVYSVDYKITNKDGFSATASRTIIVLDPTDPVEGIYAIDPNSYRDYGGNLVKYGRPFEFLVINKGSYYYFDDIFAGWYAQRAGYGSNYAMEAFVSIAGDGTMTLLASLVAGWGDSVDSMGDDSKYDFATHTFTYNVDYAGLMTFNVTATRK